MKQYFKNSNKLSSFLYTFNQRHFELHIIGSNSKILIFFYIMVSQEQAFPRGHSGKYNPFHQAQLWEQNIQSEMDYQVVAQHVQSNLEIRMHFCSHSQLGKDQHRRK